MRMWRRRRRERSDGSVEGRWQEEIYFMNLCLCIAFTALKLGLCICGRHSLSCIAPSATLDIPITTMIHSFDCIASLALK